jgi:hypothetical protein
MAFPLVSSVLWRINDSTPDAPTFELPPGNSAGAIANPSHGDADVSEIPLAVPVVDGCSPTLSGASPGCGTAGFGIE